MPEFETDPFGKRNQLPHLTSREAAPACWSSDLFEKARVSALNGIPVSRASGLPHIDGVHREIYFLGQLLYFSFRIPAVIVHPVGYDQQRLSGIVATSRLLEGHVEGIEKRR